MPPPTSQAWPSGILNMTRGLGTSLGLALAGLAYTLGAGRGSAIPAGAVTGYGNAAVFFTVVAALAALTAAVRGRTALSHDTTLTAE